MVVRMNEYVEERIAGPEELGRTYSQQLSIDSIYRQGGHAVVGSQGLLHQRRTEVSTNDKHYYDKRGQSDANTLLEEAGVQDSSDQEFYRLSNDEIYYVEFRETLSVPEDHVGLIVPQESLLRAGIMMHSSPIGPEEDSAEALITVEENSVLLQDNSSVVEMIVLEPTPKTTRGGDDDDRYDEE